jgi:sialate O-acetylesterase
MTSQLLECDQYSCTIMSHKGVEMRIRSGFALAAALLCRGAWAQSPPLLDELFQDHAVLQRDHPIAMWGLAAGNEIVTVSLGSATARARADASGRWKVTLPALAAGGPFVLTAQGSSGAHQRANDILLGDVFLCSGQSNMELPVLRAGDSGNEIASAANDTIRMLTVQHASSPETLARFPNSLAWQIAAPATVPDWSAACFYFARELQKSIHVPLGLVHASWGGSNIRPWMSAGALRTIDAYRPALDTLALYAHDQPAAQAQFAAQWEGWWRGQSGDRPGAEPWNPSGNWQPVPGMLDDWRKWRVAPLENFTGLVWFRTRFALTAAQAAAAATLNLGPINQVDQTWINAHPVGNTFGYGTERSYRLAPGMLHAGENLLVINVLSSYGSGGLLAGGTPRALQPQEGPPVPLSGAWEYRVVPIEFGYPPSAPWEPVDGLSTLYNAMIAPLGAYGLRGAVWYQGESNTDEAGTYQQLLTGLMADWRRQFGADLPFLIVQLPNYGAQPVATGESDWANLREAQRQAVLRDPRAGLAVTIDVGDAHNLHPSNKQDVGRRLARVARRVIYGEKIAPSGPVPRSVMRSADQIVVDFGDVEGVLVTYSHDTPIGFELCTQAAGSCHYAQGRIRNTQVLLSVAPGAPAPTRVRYCWADSPVCNLFDRSGLPAGPFELNIGQ